MRGHAGSSIRPDPNGQIPTMARMSVVFPVPEGPTMATRSPAAMLAFTWSSSTRPSGDSSRSSESWTASRSDVTRWIADSERSRSAASITETKLQRRSTFARQRAIS